MKLSGCVEFKLCQLGWGTLVQDMTLSFPLSLSLCLSFSIFDAYSKKRCRNTAKSFEGSLRTTLVFEFVWSCSPCHAVQLCHSLKRRPVSVFVKFSASRLFSREWLGPAPFCRRPIGADAHGQNYNPRRKPDLLENLKGLQRLGCK